MAEHELQRQQIPTEAALQALNTIIQLHFEKTLEKKRAVDLQKKALWKSFHRFFLFLSVVFAAQAASPRLHCRHCWVPVAILTLAHLIFYASVAQTLRCINGFKYQRRCHKLTLGLATDRLRRIKARLAGASAGEGMELREEDVEIHYQEPPESYFGVDLYTTKRLSCGLPVKHVASFLLIPDTCQPFYRQVVFMQFTRQAGGKHAMHTFDTYELYTDTLGALNYINSYGDERVEMTSNVDDDEDIDSETNRIL